jgi:hypothetical protein
MLGLNSSVIVNSDLMWGASIVSIGPGIPSRSGGGAHVLGSSGGGAVDLASGMAGVCTSHAGGHWSGL